MYEEGDMKAFDTLFDRFHVPVYNFAYSLFRDPDGCEEVLQEAFFTVARSAGSYTPRWRFRTWLMSIVHNRCLNHMEMQRVRKRHMIQPPTAPAESVADGAPTDKLELGEYLRTVRDAITSLSERQREAIVLYAYEQMSYRDIAEVLDMSLNTLKTLIHRA